MMQWVMRVYVNQVCRRGGIAVAVSFMLLMVLCTSCGSASPVLASSDQMTRAKEMVARLNAADQAIVSGDEYLAAVGLLPLYGQPLVDAKISRVAGAVPGGFVYEGIPPYFVSFVSPEKIPLANWPRFSSQLLAISLDGTRALVNDSRNEAKEYVLDIATGNLELFQVAGTPSRHSLEWVVSPVQGENLVIQNTRTQEKLALCAPANSHYRWSRDSAYLVATDGDTSMVYIINIPSTECEKVKLADLDWNAEVLLTPSAQTLVIILPGAYGSSKKSVLMTANRDGTGIKKVAELPSTGRAPGSEAILSPDGEALYLDGYLISLVSGAYVATGGNVIAWLSSPPPSAILRDIQLNVVPESGERGTKFAFEMTGLPVGQEVSWVILRDTTAEQGVVMVTRRVDGTGTITAGKDDFYFKTGLGTEAGIYYLIVYQGVEQVGLKVFSVTEP